MRTNWELNFENYRLGCCLQFTCSIEVTVLQTLLPVCMAYPYNSWIWHHFRGGKGERSVCITCLCFCSRSVLEQCSAASSQCSGRQGEVPWQCSPWVLYPWGSHSRRVPGLNSPQFLLHASWQYKNRTVFKSSTSWIPSRVLAQTCTLFSGTVWFQSPRSRIVVLTVWFSSFQDKSCNKFALSPGLS